MAGVEHPKAVRPRMAVFPGQALGHYCCKAQECSLQALPLIVGQLPNELAVDILTQEFK